ncbi:family 43 glycosylhydrolase [Streptomyces sp. NBC_01474]|uniref:family 43 glycosylhydrolase n=1 Tax=Streptomyces sp. NBC_01474 TaxID=2903880 RepID=UPI003FA35998
MASDRSCGDQTEQVGLERIPTPGGVWALTLPYRDGLFYLIVTVFLGGRGCIVFTATDPAGPWSDGVSIPAVDGIDPDISPGTTTALRSSRSPAIPSRFSRPAST